MTPAGEGFEPGHLTRRDRDLRLVIEDDLPPRDRLAQIGLQRDATGIVRVVLVTVDGCAIPGAFRHVESDVGPLEQRLRG